jgi:hypothetical protein
MSLSDGKDVAKPGDTGAAECVRRVVATGAQGNGYLPAGFSTPLKPPGHPLESYLEPIDNERYQTHKVGRDPARVRSILRRRLELILGGEAY